MGGYNSGRWCGVITRATTDQTVPLDLAKVRKGVDSIFLWTATLGDRQMRVRFEPTFSQRVARVFATISGHSFTWPVELVTTQPRFGGCRFWFSCPRCGERRRVLRLAFSPALGCHGCLNLAYATQRMNRYWRLNRRLDRIWIQLGGTEETMGRRYWPKRPKWRRRATQMRLRHSWLTLNDAIWYQGSADLARFLRLK